MSSDINPVQKVNRSSREALSEVLRELGVRRRCYGRWVADGKLSDVDAQDRLERLEKAADIVERAVLLEGVQGLAAEEPVLAGQSLSAGDIRFQKGQM